MNCEHCGNYFVDSCYGLAAMYWHMIVFHNTALNDKDPNLTSTLLKRKHLIGIDDT